MAKVETIKFGDFMKGDWQQDKTIVIKVIGTSAAIAKITLPKMALAAGVNGTFGNMHVAIMNGFDAGVVLVIIFAGAAWALGHRQKAIEIIIGVCCGYILARHAIDIRDFLKGI